MADLYKRAYEVAKQENLWRSVKPLDVVCQDFCSGLSVKFDPFAFKDGAVPAAYKQGLAYLLRVGCGAPLTELTSRGLVGQNDVDYFSSALAMRRIATDASPQLSYGMRVACNAVSSTNWALENSNTVFEKYVEVTGANPTILLSPKRTDTVASIRMGFFYITNGILREHYDDIPNRYGFQSISPSIVRRSKRIVTDALKTWDQTEKKDAPVFVSQTQEELVLQ